MCSAMVKTAVRKPRAIVRSTNNFEHNTTYNYFREIKDPGLICLSVFENQWGTIRRHDFSSEQIVDILKWTAQAVSKNLNSNDQIKFRDAISQNWQSWEHSAIDQIGFFDGRDCADIFAALKTLKIRPSQDFLVPFLKRLDTTKDNLRARYFSNIFQGAACVGITLPSSLNDTFRRNVTRVSGFGRKTDKTPLLWSCAINDSMHPNQGYEETAVLLKRMLPKRIRDPKGIRQRQKQRHDSALWFNWNMAGFQNPDRNESTISGDERTFNRYLQNIGISTNATNTPIVELPQAIDMTIFYQGVPILTEVDGPTHYVNTSLHNNSYMLGEDLDGQTKFRSALMAKLNPEDTFLRISTKLSSALVNAPSAKQLSAECRKRLTLCFLNGVIASNDQFNQAYVEIQNGAIKCGVRPFLHG